MTDAPLVIQGRNSFHVLSELEVIDDTKETAASWASEFIEFRPDFGWIVARYVEADNPNRNGHIFPLDELRTRYRRVVHTPLNMLHRVHHVVGTFTAAKLLPGAGQTAVPEAASEMARAVLNPHVETVSAFWRYAFPNEYRATRKAFQERSAWLSMEAVPKSITCVVDGKTFPYKGPTHASYCEHLQASPRAQRILNDAHFVGGGIILPPTRPGWADADIRDIAGVIEHHEQEAEQIYDAMAAAAPHLDPAQWEAAMAVVVARAFGTPPPAPTLASALPVDRPWTATETAPSIYLPGAKRDLLARADQLGIASLVPEHWKPDTAAASVPDEVRDAYLARLASLKMEPSDTFAVQKLDYTHGTLWACIDGWGEWFFAQEGDKVRWVAQKWPDVRAFYTSAEIGWGKEDVKKLGLGTDAWMKALAAKLAGKPLPAKADAVGDVDFDVVALEAQAANNGKKGAMVCIAPPEDIAAQLAELGTEPAEVLHVTLAFLGDLMEENEDVVSLDEPHALPTTRERVMAAVGAFAAGAPQLRAKVSGIGQFDIGGGNAVTYASVDVPGLPEMRERLVAALDSAGIAVSRKHGLSPHISLRYDTTEEAPPPVGTLPDGLEWLVTHLEVWWSDEHRFRYELVDGKVSMA